MATKGTGTGTGATTAAPRNTSGGSSGERSRRVAGTADSRQLEAASLVETR